MTIGIGFALVAVFGLALWVQSILLKKNAEEEMAELRSEIRRLKTACDEATERADKLEEELRGYLAQLSNMMSRIG